MAGAVSAALGAAGCAERPEREPADTPQTLMSTQLRRAAAGTPERAALVWWRALQLRDTERVLASMTAAARAPLTRSNAARAFAQAAAQWSRRATPRLVDVERTGHGSTVYLRLGVQDLIVEGLARQKEHLLALPLRRGRRGWLIDDSAWLRELEGGLIPPATRVSNPREVARVRHCLRAAGLQVERSAGLEGSTALNVALATEETALVYVFADRRAARVVLPEVTTLFVQAGGGVRARGVTIVAWTKPVAARDFKPIESCV